MKLNEFIKKCITEIEEANDHHHVYSVSFEVCVNPVYMVAPADKPKENWQVMVNDHGSQRLKFMISRG